MNGAMIVCHAGGALTAPLDITEVPARGPGLEKLQALVAGYIELVPHFHTVEVFGGVQPCIAFVNGDGKVPSRWQGVDRKELPVNRRATLLWEAAVTRLDKAYSLKNADGSFRDFIVGTMVILTGDEAFMRSLRDNDEDEAND